jgi:putative transposase
LSAKTSKFTEAQIAFALRQTETGTRVPEVCRKMEISEQTSYPWKHSYGGLAKLKSEISTILVNKS